MCCFKINLRNKSQEVNLTHEHFSNLTAGVRQLWPTKTQLKQNMHQVIFRGVHSEGARAPLSWPFEWAVCAQSVIPTLSGGGGWGANEPFSYNHLVILGSASTSTTHLTKGAEFSPGMFALSWRCREDLAQNAEIVHHKYARSGGRQNVSPKNKKNAFNCCHRIPRVN